MTVEAWLAMAVADVAKRKLPELIPLLEGLARATESLRRAAFNDDPAGGGQAATGVSDRPNRRS